MSWRLGVSPTPLIVSPFSLIAVTLVMLLPRRAASSVSPCRSATFCATRAPLALYQGPVPMRSRAFTAGWPLAALALRYACQVLVLPAAVASVWQMRSAPASPPRSAPLPDPALATKNDIGGGGCAGCPAGGGGCCASSRYELEMTRAASPAMKVLRMNPSCMRRILHLAPC